ncbi:MAG TPA: helix-turn-helix domain-containing protein [Thermoanaerobaculia bacterium]|nr:helix-turn-helix domain-containing protein [Thermoanaerobaculia bacterium]
MYRPVECRALAVMREDRGWKKKRLAASLGIRPATLYAYEGGRLVPSRDLLERAAAVLELPPWHVDRTLLFLRMSDASRRSGANDPGAEARLTMDRIALSKGMEVEEFFRGLLERGLAETLDFLERQSARVLWAELRTISAAERRAAVSEVERFRSWGLAELLCHESEDAAADDADEALELARLAEVVAGRVRESEAFLSRLQGYAVFHLGNALRVKGSLPDSDASFERALHLWKSGADPGKRLSEARVLDLEASLRRAQRLFPQALDLLDQALAADTRRERTGRILIKRAKTLEEQDRYEEAIDTLRRAEPYVDVQREPRLLWNLRFNLVENLLQAGRFTEAAPMIAEVRWLALQFGKRLNLVRLAWLEARILAGLGRPGEAEPRFEQVRKEFLARGIAYDSALVSFEMAVLYQEQGRTAEVKTLARELAPVFRAQNVSRETLATVTLFQQAVETETLTVEMARSLLEDLRRARHQERNSGEDPDRSRGGRPRPGRRT